MNNYIETVLKALNEQVINPEDELEEELGNTTSAYAGGEGPQRTPYAFGGSMAAKKKKFARKSAVYDNPVEETNLWFKKVENSEKHQLQKNYERFFESSNVDETGVKEADVKTLDGGSIHVIRYDSGTIEIWIRGETGKRIAFTFLSKSQARALKKLL